MSAANSPNQKSQAEKNADKAVQAASATVDAVVPGAGRAMKLAWKGRKQLIAMAVILVLLLGMCGTGQMEPKAPIDPVEVLEELVASQVTEEAKKAALITGDLETEGVPWTLINAISMTATANGRFSPYDLCDRLPGGNSELERPGYSADQCSEEPSVEDRVTPDIGGEADPALGPFLLRRGVITKNGKLTIDPQDFTLSINSVDDDPETAMDFVTVRLAELRKELTDEGYDFSQDDAALAASSWAEAVRRLGVMSPNDTAGCATPGFATDRNVNAKAVETTWRCHLMLQPLYTFATSSAVAGPAMVSPTAAVELAIREALTVSWAFSRWGTVPVGCSTDSNGYVSVTAAADAPAGFFPLTESVFKEFTLTAEANRCDPAANVTAAVRAYAAGESIEPGKKRDDNPLGDRTDDKGPWQKAIGGWQAMPWALGADLAQLPAEGPLSVESTKFTPSDTCKTDVTMWLERASTTLQTTYTPELAELPQSDAALIAAHVAANALPSSCEVKPNAKRVFNTFIAGEAQVPGSALWNVAAPPPTTTVVPDPANPTAPPAPVVMTPDMQRASALLALARWFETRPADAVSATPTAPVPGVSSLVPRLSLSGAVLPACDGIVAVTCLPAFPAATQDPYAARVVLVARASGGIVEGDEHSEPGLLELLAQPRFGSLATTTCFPAVIGKAIDTALAKYKDVMLQSTEAPALRERRARSVIPVDLILEQFATESSFGIGVVDDAGWTGTRMAPVGGVADVGVQRTDDPSDSRSMTKGIIGPQMIRNGAPYPDSDQGRIDGLVGEDRAVGVLQFLPSSWMGYERLFPGLLLDANGDGIVDPHNAYDQTLAMVLYYARNAEGEDLSLNLTKREETIAQYGGFTVGSEGFRKYMAFRLKRVAPYMECLLGEGTMADTQAGVQLGPDGCPTAVPQNTLRNGALQVGVTKLCQTAVAQAPTPEAKKALLYLFANLGAPYDADRRMDDGFYDCSSYAMRAYRAAGIATGNWSPSSYLLGPADGYSSYNWLRTLPWSQKRAGGLLVKNPPYGNHVMIYLYDDWLIHTGGPVGDPAHIRKIFDEPEQLKVRRVVPELAPRVKTP